MGCNLEPANSMPKYLTNKINTLKLHHFTDQLRYEIIAH